MTKGNSKTGEQEKKCLEIVKSGIFYKGGVPLCEPFTKKIYSDTLSEEEFQKDHIWFVNSECYKRYFGFLEENREEIEYILHITRENPNKTEFPDFIFSNGFIEHFHVTSSQVNRKGAVHKKKMKQFEVKIAKEIKLIKQKWNKIPSYNITRSKHWGFNNPNHTYEFLVESFKYTWDHHISSLNKYNGNKNIGIFMVEYEESALSMLENVYSDWIDGMSQGDMRQQEELYCYRLSRDRKLLEFVYQYKEQIKYVIFVYKNRNKKDFEIIKVDNIPYLLKIIPWGFVVRPLCDVKQVSSVYNISVSSIGKAEK